MAMYCVRGSGECTGCGECSPKPFLCDYMDMPIFEGDSYYDFDGEIVSEENLDGWLAQFVKTAEPEEGF